MELPALRPRRAQRLASDAHASQESAPAAAEGVELPEDRQPEALEPKAGPLRAALALPQGQPREAGLRDSEASPERHRPPGPLRWAAKAPRLREDQQEPPGAPEAAPVAAARPPERPRWTPVHRRGRAQLRSVACATVTLDREKLSFFFASVSRSSEIGSDPRQKRTGEQGRRLSTDRFCESRDREATARVP